MNFEWEKYSCGNVKNVVYLSCLLSCLEKKTGEAVKKGELLATLFSNDEAKFEDSEKLFLSAFRFSDEKPQPVPLIYKTVR